MTHDAATVWLLIVSVGIAVYITRGLFILQGRNLKLSPGMQRILRYAPTAVLMAIVAPDLGLSHGALALSIDNARLLAGLAGFAIAIVSRSILITIAGGMLVLTGFKILFGMPL